jgi:hypothetical protein
VSAEAYAALGDDSADPLSTGLSIPDGKAAELVTLAVSRMLVSPSPVSLAILSLRSRSVNPRPRPCGTSGSEGVFGPGSP